MPVPALPRRVRSRGASVVAAVLAVVLLAIGPADAAKPKRPKSSGPVTTKRAPCIRTLNPGVLLPLRVTGGKASAIVVWDVPKISAIRSFRVAAVAQQFVHGVIPPPKWSVLTAAGTACHEITLRMSGLVSNMNYEFWLDAIVPNDQPIGGTVELNVGASSVIHVN